jgi:hypothetical protein
MVHALRREKEQALNYVRDGPGFPTAQVRLAFVLAWTGEKDAAIAEYAKLFNVSSSQRPNVHEMRHHPMYHPLRSDPRFEALLNHPKNNAPLF